MVVRHHTALSPRRLYAGKTDGVVGMKAIIIGAVLSIWSSAVFAQATPAAPATSPSERSDRHVHGDHAAVRLLT
jgi:hypothetical protein